MHNFFLFRIKAERHAYDLFSDERLQSPELIKRAIDEKPSKEVRKNQIWRLGNTEFIDDTAVLFAFGKVLKSKRDVYDEENGNFTEVDDTDAPHTYVVIDLETQVCAIAGKSSMKMQIGNVAFNLAKVLSSTEICKNQSALITVSAINDPDDFIKSIQSSESILMFEMTFSPPNPFDVEEDFHKPMEKLLEESNAGKGKTRIDGEDLDKGVVGELARSAASTGDEATARIKTTGSSKSILKRLSGNQSIISVDDIVTKEEKRGLLDSIRDAYRRIRGD
ncbi:MAG: hypothetical protein M3O61_13320 [Gemmatimonadota bacterium]|nr:hypothetical protein [Gemmatimonadota bacterium]